MNFHQFIGPFRLDVECFATRMEFSTTIHISAEQERVIRERELKDPLTQFIKDKCSSKSFPGFLVEPLRTSFTEKARSQVSGIKIVIRLNFPSDRDQPKTMRYELSRRILLELFKAIRHEIRDRTGLPFVNRSTSPGRSLGKSGESIASLKKERDRAKRERNFVSESRIFASRTRDGQFHFNHIQRK